MTAPAITVRGTPSGIKLENSFPVRVAFSLNPTIGFWEKNIQPPGLDNGEKIDQTTQFNQFLRTYAPRYLKDVTDMKGKAAYDPGVYTDLLLLIGHKGSVTKQFSDGSTISFYGYLKSFVPADQAGDGTQPEADFEIVATNVDPSTGAEEPPVVVSVAGT